MFVLLLHETSPCGRERKRLPEFCGALSSPALTLTPAPLGKQTVRYSNGTPTIISWGKENSVVLTVLPNPPSDLVFAVLVHNRLDHPANVGTENVRADSNGHALRVFTYDELVKKTKSADGWQRFAPAAAGRLRAGAAAQPAQTNYFGQYQGYDQCGQYQGTVIGQATTTDPASQAAAQSLAINDDRTQAGMLDRQMANKMQQLNQILRTTTVSPGKMIEGMVQISRSGVKDRVNVLVTFNGETHVFHLVAHRENAAHGRAEFSDNLLARARA